jgi:hypothetical protein
MGIPRTPALLGGLAAAFAPLTTANFGFVYFSAWGGIALVLLAAEAFLHERTLRSGAAWGIAAGTLAWFSLQLFAFSLAALACFLAIRLLTQKELRRDPRTLLRGLTGGLALGFVILPLAIPLLSVRQREGFARDETEVRKYSATPATWITTTPHSPEKRILKTTTSEAALYPGSAAVILGLLALALLRRGSPHLAPAAAGLGLAVFGIIASLGFHGPVYPALVALLPPIFGGIRSAFRFAYVAQTGFGLLAAAGAGALWKRFGLGEAGLLFRSSLVGIALGAIFTLGAQRLPFDHRPPITAGPVDRFLAGHPAAGPILFLPLTHRPAETRLMLRSSFWGFPPLVNGNISYVPSGHQELAAALSGEVIPPSVLETIERWPVGMIVCPDAALPLRQRGATLRFLAQGVEAGRLEGPEVVEESGEPVFVFGVSAARRKSGMPAIRPAGARMFLESVQGVEAPIGVEDPEIPASIDEPAEGSKVRGNLVVRGWAQTEAGPSEVIDIRIQGSRRTPVSSRRSPRPDVGAALPRLGDPSRAGYEAVISQRQADTGRFLLDVTVQAADGRIRTLRTEFVWTR